MEWKWIWHTDWSLWSTGRSDRVVRSDDDDDDDVSPLFPPTDTLVRSSVLTHVLCRVLHGSPPSWWWWWMTVCGDRLTRRPLDVDPPAHDSSSTTSLGQLLLLPLLLLLLCSCCRCWPPPSTRSSPSTPGGGCDDAPHLGDGYHTTVHLAMNSNSNLPSWGPQRTR